MKGVFVISEWGGAVGAGKVQGWEAQVIHFRKELKENVCVVEDLDS